MLPSIINARDPKSADVTILTAKYDDTSSYAKGAAKGPDKVMECLHSQIEIFDSFLKRETSYEMAIAHVDMGRLNGMAPERVFARIKEAYGKLLATDTFPLLIGGEHSITIGALAALSETLDPKEVTVVQVDAHFDLRNDDSDYHTHPTKYAHSAVMRRAHEMGYNLLNVGARSFCKEEYDYATSHPDTIGFFQWGAVVPSVEEVLAAVKTSKVYLTIDIDGIDPAYMPGTGTPVQGGLEWYYFFSLLNALFRGKEIIAADVNEILPQKDSVVTEFGAAQIAYTICGYAGKKA